MARGWQFGIYKEGELYNLCSENKGADQLVKLISVFVFAHAKCLFSYGMAQINNACSNQA